MTLSRTSKLILAGIALGAIIITAVLRIPDSSKAAFGAPACDPAGLPNAPRHPSPDQRYSATDSAVIDTQADRCAFALSGSEARFVGWSADSRFAVFNGDQGIAFDVRTWDRVPIHDSAGAAVAFSPIMKRVLFADGTLLILFNAEQYALLDDPRSHIIAAAFSPGEQFLAYVIRADADHALVVSNGDGSNPRHFLDVDAAPNEAIAITWNQDDTPKFTLRVGSMETLVNVWTGEIIP